MIYTIIPAFNEEESLESLIPILCKVLSSTKEGFKILVVNDGSNDRTADVSRSFACRYPLKVVSHGKNQGIGAVFRTGIQEACSAAGDDDVIIIMEGDRTSDPSLIPAIMARIRDGSDVVIASRFIERGGFRGFPLRRLILSYGANYLFRLLFPIRGATDYTIFYRGYRGKTLRTALARYEGGLIEARTFVANAELLLKLNNLSALKVSEIPMIYSYKLKKGKSKLRIAQTLAEYVSFVTKALREKGR